MSFISPEYLDLNKKLHDTDPRYGTGSFRWSQQVMELKDDIGARTILDYGCGKGTLKIALGGGAEIIEYDPAVPGKDGKPPACDLVVCSDVLEHVEPNQLEHVLHHIWKLAKRAVFIVISTAPSSKTLDDGRNAHLIQEDRAWWRQRLERYFHFSSWNATAVEIVAIGQRIYELGDIKVISAVSETMRLEQARINSAKARRRLEWCAPHSGRVSIACFGPSLKEMVDDIRNDRAAGASIVSVSGAHDFLIEKGIVPDVHIDIDPRPHKAYFTRNPNPKVRYWMASCCHPSVINNLLGYDLTLFHIMNSEHDNKIQEFDPESFMIGGGGSVGCRAINVMYTQGYRVFDIYGMDCSFTDKGEQHAGYHSGKRQQTWNCRCDGRWFKSSGTWVATAKGVIENMLALERASREQGSPKIAGDDCIVSRFHGDGLLPAMIRAGTPIIELSRSTEDYRAPEVEPDASPAPGEVVSRVA